MFFLDMPAVPDELSVVFGCSRVVERSGNDGLLV